MLEKHLHLGCRRSAYLLLKVKLWGAALSPVLCKQCELVQKMPPGGREEVAVAGLLVLVKLFGPATGWTRTCAPLSSFSLLLHTSELVFCVRPDR